MNTNYSTKTGTFFNLPSNQKSVPEIGFMESLSLFKKVLLDKSSRSPKSNLPEVKPDLTEFLKPAENMKFIWFGHSTLLLNIDGKIIMIDPVFFHASPLEFMVKRFQPPVLKLEQLPHIDIIVISHNHYDHLDKKTIKHFKNKSTGFIVPIGVGDNLREWEIPGQRIVELNWGETISHNGLSFTATPAQHFSGRGFFDRNETLWASWIIRGLNENLFYSGDSGYGDHFKEIGRRYGPFDVTFIENGQYNERWPDVHMQPEESLQAHLDLNGKIFVPVHWGMFSLALHHWNEPIERSYKIATAWDIPILTPQLGEITDIGDPIVNRPWWNLQTEEKSNENFHPCLDHFNLRLRRNRGASGHVST